MAKKHIALAAALLGFAIPGHAFDTRSEATTVMFYYAIPLDAKTKKENNPWLGMQLNGKREFQSYSSDVPLFRLSEEGSRAANLLVVGGIAVGAAALVASRGKSSQQQVQQDPKIAAPASQVPCDTGCPPK
jgi:hypothetical protein